MLEKERSLGAPGVHGQMVKNTRIYIPQRLKDKATLLIEGINNYKQLGDYGSFGALFFGPPGTGKSIFARYIAEKTEAIFFEAKMVYQPSQVYQIYGAARNAVKDKEKDKAIVVFDDLDELGKRSESMNIGLRPVLAQLLSETDPKRTDDHGRPLNLGVFTFISSNIPDQLDEALRRPPRTTFEIDFFPPTMSERKLIIDAILSDKAMSIEWTNELRTHAASISYGFTPADLLGIIEAASILAIVRKSKGVSKEDINQAKGMQKPAAIRDMPFIEPKEKFSDIVGSYIEHQKQLFSELGARIDNGISMLLYGPSGWGKTAIAYATAGQFGFNCLLFDTSQILSKWVGDAGKALARAFRRAEDLKPCFLILDQAEGIINPNNPYSSEWLSVLKSKLSEPIPGVFVMMITTNPFDWGKDILGRLFKVYIPASRSEEDLKRLFERYLPANHKVDIDSVVKYETGRLTPRSIKEMVRRLQDLGGEPTTESLKNAMRNFPREDAVETINYGALREVIGDDTDLFRAAKGLPVDTAPKITEAIVAKPPDQTDGPN